VHDEAKPELAYPAFGFSGIFVGDGWFTARIIQPMKILHEHALLFYCLDTHFRYLLKICLAEMAIPLEQLKTCHEKQEMVPSAPLWLMQS
jgi:hypothetical protein